MRIVGLSTLVKQGCITFSIIAVALVEALGGCRHVDERHAQLRGQLLHLVAVVHRMVALCYAQTTLEFTIDNGVILTAQVVATRTCNLVIAAKITTANGRNENRCGTLLLDGIDNLRQALLIRSRRCSAASVFLHGSGISGVTFISIILLQLEVVYTIVLTVVVRKLDKHIVTGFHAVLGVLPQFVVATTTVTTTFGVVDRSPAVGQEVTEVHSPTTGVGSTLVVRCHR